MSGAQLGPWGEARANKSRAPSGAPGPKPRPVYRQPDQQSLGWALASTVLLAGYLWWAMGSWIYPLAGVFGVLVHEFGHVLAFNALGMGPGRIFIVPFLGGAAAPRVPADTEWNDVLSSLAGPAFGLLAAIPFYGVWMATGEKIWLEGAWFIAIINLLNLLPAPPLDGSKALGPVLARVHPMLEKVALVAVGAAVIFWGIRNGSWLFPLLIGLVLFNHLRSGFWRPHARKLTWGGAGVSFALYLGTVALCGAALFFISWTIATA